MDLQFLASLKDFEGIHGCMTFHGTMQTIPQDALSLHRSSAEILIIFAFPHLKQTEQHHRSRRILVLFQIFQVPKEPRALQRAVCAPVEFSKLHSLQS